LGSWLSWPKAPRCRRGIPLGSPRFESLTAHQCSGGATGRRVRSRAALLRVRISPRTPQARSPTRQRQHAQTVSSVGSNPTEPTKAPVVQLVETAALKAAQCRFESGQAHHTPRLPMVRRADSKPAIGCSNHPWGAMRRNSKWRAAELQPRCARFDSAAALQVFRTWRSGRVAKVTSPENWRESVRATEG
jgi:hypothetical protein